jgi:hypothetical protein
MNDLLLGYALTIVFVFVMGFLMVLYKYFIGNKLTKAANKLQSQMANIRRDFPNIERNPREFVGQNIGELGIAGILEELGVPKVFQPLAQGFIDKIASNPEILQGYAEKLGIKLPGGGNESKNEGTDLL